MSLTQAEQLSSPVLERAVSRSAISWVHYVRAACASDCTPASKKPYARVIALPHPKLCAGVVAPLHLKLHALAVMPRPAPERLHARVVVLLVYAFTKCLRLIVMPRL